MTKEDEKFKGATLIGVMDSGWEERNEQLVLEHLKASVELVDGAILVGACDECPFAEPHLTPETCTHPSAGEMSLMAEHRRHVERPARCPLTGTIGALVMAKRR